MKDCIDNQGALPSFMLIKLIAMKRDHRLIASDVGEDSVNRPREPDQPTVDQHSYESHYLNRGL